MAKVLIFLKCQNKKYGSGVTLFENQKLDTAGE